MPPLLPGNSILTKSPDSRSGKKGGKTESRKTPLYSVSNPSDPPVTEPQWEELNLEKVKELAKKGDALSWSDFEPYRHADIGSELHIYFYDIDVNYCLVIGGEDTQAVPQYIRLVLKPYDHEFLDDDAYIEIRTENVDDFINSQNN